jgi:ATP-binding protein involved in chromosome partitioning
MDSIIIEKRLERVKRIICVASCKGGVGKSLISSLMGLHLSKKFEVGLLDLDVFGPSSHIILGVKDLSFPEEDKGIIPPTVNGLRFMSIVYFTKDKPLVLRGAGITNVITEILGITQWGSLDFLIIDMPPGIGEETLDIIRLIRKKEFLVVTTPSRVSIGGVCKLLTLLKELRIPILGLLENMKISDSTLVMDKAIEVGIPYLGPLHFDERLEDAIGNSNLLLKTRFMHELEKVASCFSNRK